MDDVAGSKPEPMSEETVMEILQGHKFKFEISNYEQYLKDSRKIAEKTLIVPEFSIDTAI